MRHNNFVIILISSYIYNSSQEKIRLFEKLTEINIYNFTIQKGAKNYNIFTNIFMCI